MPSETQLRLIQKVMQGTAKLIVKRLEKKGISFFGVTLLFFNRQYRGSFEVSAGGCDRANANILLDLAQEVEVLQFLPTECELTGN
jgi:hypothetical protein